MSIIEHPLDFERPLVEIETKLAKLGDELAAGNSALRDEYAELEAKVSKIRKDIYGKLTAYQRVQLSRHFDRPCTNDYIAHIVGDFVELHGDRAFRDDSAIVGGLGSMGPTKIMLIGHQRGRTIQERIKRNFGMPNPEGYRKALRLMKMASRFKLPIVTFIDTQGAFPGMEAEERGQAEAIARNLLELSLFPVPVISVVIGEGGSGGALALGVSDRILMMENACYSVITPEGCASILWHHDRNEAPQDQAASAAQMLQLTAQDLMRNGIIDEIVSEPLGGAHRNYGEAAENLKLSVLKAIGQLSKLSESELIESRYQKFRKMGPYSENN